MKLLKYIFKNPLEFLLCIILVSLVIISFAQVISRYVLHVSLSWSEESCRFLLMWLGMLSAAYGFKVKSHFSLSFIKNKFSIRFQRLVTLVTTGLMSVFLVIFKLNAAQTEEMSSSNLFETLYALNVLFLNKGILIE